ncbi:hypothetical protein CR513_25971, partial [Mucuna pruriens]
MGWSSKRRIPIWKATISEPTAAILVESRSRVAFSTKIWTSQEHAESESRKLSTVGSKILGTCIPPTTTTTNAIL